MGRGKIERRGSKPRRTKPVILIVTEGEKSEPKYFEHFRTRQNNVEVRVVPNSKNGSKTDYLNLIRKASRICKDDDLSPKSGDSVWIVADGDVNYQAADAIKKKNAALTQARATAEKEAYSLLISNPCFELWYLLHLRYTTAHLPDYDAVKKALEQAGIKDYEKHNDLYEQMASETIEAIKRAKRLETHQVENGFTLPLGIDANPFTEVYRLMENLVLTDQSNQ
ncbi:MAG: RloB domain-containing protein [Clostridia bacterium]|nr:RloB domain-containing protein [Clostridia bacterium]